MLLLVVAQLLYQLIPQLLNMTALSVLKILRLMVKINSRCFFVSVNGAHYLVKYGNIDEFICLFLPSVIRVVSMTTAHISWEHEYQWYKRI